MRRDLLNFVCLILLLLAVAIFVPLCAELVHELRIHRVQPPPGPSR